MAVLVTLAFAAANAGAAAAQALAAGNARCGGVGSDERHALAAAAPSANLSLELFVERGGEYVADVDVRIHPADARAGPLSLHADGPICLLTVSPGTYRIEATFAGVTRTAQAVVPPRGRKHVAIAFPKSVGDRQTDAASPEEKMQAGRYP